MSLSKGVVMRNWMCRASAVVIPAAMLLAGGCSRRAETAAPDRSDPWTVARRALAQIDGTIAVPGAAQTVEVLRDEWGVPHIYAQNTEDLFFAQGYVMAQDRLWEMEWWRRELEGRLSEVLGPPAVDRDRLARALKYRGPFDDTEWTSYHPDAKRIFAAYANGINAFIDTHKDNLPVEFVLTGIQPLPWTAETVALREPAFGNAVSELRLAMDVAKLGVKEANRRAAPDPYAELTVPPGLDVSLVTDAAIAATRAGQALPRLELVEPYTAASPRQARLTMPVDRVTDPGSNNWVVSGAMSPSGKPIVSNDPHRAITNPSLRYIVHLNAPGWNVVGAAQPPFLGVSIGHNDRLAWGLTITGTDFQDVFIEELNPANDREALYAGKYEPLRVITESIRVKGESAPRSIDLLFSRHGPVFHLDTTRHRAYVLRSAFMEPGTASYLASLKLDQARTCQEFLDLAIAWKANSENLICGDVDGNIGFQASGYAPKRNGWDGRLPVPGTGRYEWGGQRMELPREYNPPRGFIATANHNINTPGYWPPVVFKTTNTVPYDRITRILQVIKPGAPFSMDASRALQRDVYSLRGAIDQKAFQGWTASDPAVERARAMIAGWDANLTRDSVPAAIYVTWRRAATDGRDADPSPTARDRVEAALKAAVDQLTRQMGSDWNQWRYGRVHTQPFPHPVLTAFDLPTVERRGGNGAVGADGASFREIIDLADWDRAITINTPGQSGQPGSPNYGNLLPLWERDEYFPMAFTRSVVDAHVAHRLVLTPGSHVPR
ncbi:MAG TPA: penicillin acylase family protein [Vicinamibacterales bacterium]|nr:penicillin acylase family protein [Vicinamibacterales bacterium]